MSDEDRKLVKWLTMVCLVAVLAMCGVAMPEVVV